MKICPLNGVLSDGSSMATSSGEERAIVVVREVSLEERDNSMGHLSVEQSQLRNGNRVVLPSLMTF